MDRTSYRNSSSPSIASPFSHGHRGYLMGHPISLLTGAGQKVTRLTNPRKVNPYRPINPQAMSTDFSRQFVQFVRTNRNAAKLSGLH